MWRVSRESQMYTEENLLPCVGSNPEVDAFFFKGPYNWSLTNIRHCHCSSNAAINNTQKNDYGHVLIKLYKNRWQQGRHSG